MVDIFRDKAFHYKADGTINEIRPVDGKYFSLKELQGYVVGYIEEIMLSGDDKYGDPLPNRYLVCNEEGKLNHLRLNEKATTIWQAYYDESDEIVGDVVFCDPKFIET